MTIRGYGMLRLAANRNCEFAAIHRVLSSIVADESARDRRRLQKLVASVPTM